MLSKNLLSEIKRKSELLNSLRPLSAENQTKLDKKFRLEFNFNSNHLEGNTLTYGETKLLLFFDQTEGTHDFREYQEMQAHDVALRLIQEEAAEKERPLTEQFIKNLNKMILVKPFWKDAITADGQPTRKQIIPGEYKKTPNSVRLANGEIFDYSAPADVQNEIAELVAWYNDKSDTEDPVLLAAILHYRFVRIHPFDDGNGRTARLLMNYVFAKSNLPLVIIKSAEKKEYLAALNRADAGDLNAFAEYIGNQLLWSLDLSIKAAKGEDIEEDEDLDKELELLKQELKGIPDEFEREKTSEDVTRVMNKSIVPLFIILNKKSELLKDAFVEINTFLITKRAPGVRTINNDYFSVSDVLAVENPFEGKKIVSAILEFEFVALKKLIKQKNIKYALSVEFDNYSYRIIDDLNNEALTILPYKSPLSKNQTNFIVKSVMKNIISEIKSATNIN